MVADDVECCPTVCCRVEQGVLWGEYVVQGEFLRGHVARQDDLSGAHWGVTAQDAGPAQPSSCCCASRMEHHVFMHICFRNAETASRRT